VLVVRPGGAKTDWIAPLDGCRAIAALAVVVDHYQPWRDLSDLAPHKLWASACSLFGFGALGVIFFFALSSFLLTTLALREHRQTGTMSIKRFYARRMLRIWPLYYTILAVYVVLASCLTRHFNTHDARWMTELWIYPPFLQNWFNVTNFDMGILWTLGVEEQFYVSFPWVMALLLMSGSRTLAIGIIAGLLVAASAWRVAVAMGMIHPIFWYDALAIHGIYFSTPTYFDVFVAGAVAAWLYVNGTKLPWLRGPMPGLMIVAALLAVGAAPNSKWLNSLTFGDATVYLGYYTLLGIAFASAILWLCANPHSAAVSFLNSAPMRYLGTISFGIYMWHIIAKVIVLTIFARIAVSDTAYFALTLISYVGLTILLAMTSYRFIERPWLKRKASYGSRITSGSAPIEFSKARASGSSA
jgi:peptidoglycan/LPS O-acetylase OafA/YrhL